MLRQIVVPLDGSPLAETILPHVRRLADGTSLAIVLLGVATLPSEVRGALAVHPSLRYGAAGAELERRLDVEEAAVRAYLDEQASALAADGLAVETEVRRTRGGDPAREIIRVAEERQADAIAMSTHGRTGLDHLLHGSVAGTVLRDSGRPLLLLRPPAEAFTRQQAARAEHGAARGGG